MPIVFVHGVNNRDGDEYRDNVEGRNAFLRQIVAPALGLGPEILLLSPYWGGEGVQFRWGMAVLPDSGQTYEKFGSGDNVEAFGRTLELAATAPAPEGFLASAHHDFPATVDLLFGAALAGTESKEDADALALSYLKAEAYAKKNPTPKWLDGATEENFAELLNYYVQKESDESFGAGGILDRLKEGLSRLENAIPSAASGAAVSLARRKLNATVTRFAGDAFVYLANRGSTEEPGPIPKIVLSALRDASAKKTSKDNKLIIIAHSFGGEIAYDLLTYYAKDLEVDTLITVGSQVGLFEEMKLYKSVDLAIPKDASKDRIKRPPNLKRWLNVFDTNDVLSYRVTPVFADTEDFFYSTGYSTLQAHGGYFLRPSFYTRLAQRLQE